MLLNCDLGECDRLLHDSVEQRVMPHIQLANIACGFHAGNRQVMRDTVALASQHGVAIGAHPSYPDREQFGRRSMALNKADICDLVLQQIELLDAICDEQGERLHHIKPHGALYNDMMQSQDVLDGILQAVKWHGGGQPLLLMAGTDNSSFQRHADMFGVEVWFEAFADRAYDDHGRLLPRSQAGAVYSDSRQVLQQAAALAAGQPITSCSGRPLQLQAKTLCVHGDNDQAVAVIEALARQLAGQ